METIIFVPGVMGSRLVDAARNEVWPPTAWEAVTGYPNPERLLDPNLVASDVIRQVCLRDLYAPLLAGLAACGYPENAAVGADRTICFPYDWRLDLFDIAAALAAKLTERHQAAAGAPQSYRLIGHSMGGLVIRLLIESGRWSSEPWFDRITACYFLATPHRGAPLALARLLGLGDGTAGLSAADVKKLTADPRYPAVYQFLPPPGDTVCWDQDRELSALDIYDPATAAGLGLSAAGLDRARALHEALDLGRRPVTTRYVLFAGSGLETPHRVDRATGAPILRMAIDGGDGTVPLYSAVAGGEQHEIAPGEHSAVFTSRPIRETLYRLLGSQLPSQPLAAGALPRATLMPRELVVAQGRPQQLLLVPDLPLDRMEGTLVLERAALAGPRDLKPNYVAVGDPLTFAYQGLAISQLQLILPARLLQQAGLYRVSLEGGLVLEAPVTFIVRRQ